MSTVRLLFPLLLFVSPALVQGQELTPFSVEEIENYLKVFKDTYNQKKVPEDDAISTLENLKNAYRYLESKGEEKSKEEAKTQERIVKIVASGLKARGRPLVTMQCAIALGDLGDPRGAKPLLRWMEKDVLKAKSPNPQYVEFGFRSMAWIGATDKNTLDFVLSYAAGKHSEASVANHALAAVIQWKQIPGKMRREFFEKILLYLSGLWSTKNGSDVTRRASAEQKYNTVKDNGLACLFELSGAPEKFADPTKAQEWWKENKRRRKWEDYIGPKFRDKKS